MKAGLRDLGDQPRALSAEGALLVDVVQRGRSIDQRDLLTGPGRALLVILGVLMGQTRIERTVRQGIARDGGFEFGSQFGSRLEVGHARGRGVWYRGL